MGLNGVNWVWVGVHGNEVLVASNLKGLAQDIGASYSTMKDRGSVSDRFSVVVGKMEDMKMWMVSKVRVKKVAGRGIKGFRVIS